MRIRPFGIAAAMASTALFSQPSLAADLPVPEIQEVVEIVQPSWAGFYLGSQIGVIVDSDDDSSFTAGGEIPVGDPIFGGRGGQTGIVTGEIEGRDLFGGVHVGYNWQRGSAVFGLEAEANSIGTVDDVLGSLRGRLGFGGERVLVYGTAGLAGISLSDGIDGVFVGGNGGNGGDAGPGGEGGAGGNGFGALVLQRAGTDDIGFAAGLGAEVKLSPSVGIGAQALYYGFDFEDAFADDDDFVTVSGRLTIHPYASALAGDGSAGSSGSWGGFYLGGHVGTLFSASDEAIDSVVLANGENGGAGVRGIDGGGGGGGAVAFAALQRNAGITGGGHLGYNWQGDSLVLGAEVDIDASSEDSNSVYGSARGRLGWASQDTMFYATGGVAVVHDDSVRGIFAGNGGNGGNGGAAIAPPGGAGGAGGQALAFGGDETKVGFVIGPGVEAKLSDRATAGLEALYYGFEDSDPVTLPAGAGRFFVAGEDTSDALVVRTRFSFALQR